MILPRRSQVLIPLTACALVGPFPPARAASLGNIPSVSTAKHPPAVVMAADPQTYPDEQGFQIRRQALIAALATHDLGKWRRGYFSGGDPGKYLPNAAMARLLENPEDAQARQFMNDERSPKEHYHFAALNWARFLPIFGAILTPATRQALAQNAARYDAYLQPIGTENHKTMNLCAAAVLPHYLEGGRLANKSRQDALSLAKEKLRSYVKGLYAAGQGEWDSPTYHMFTLHGLLAIYDFSQDPEMRSIAAAALDWLTAAYALKFREGIFCGPNQRGYYDRPWSSIADQTGWLWWGGEAQPHDLERFLYAIHPATSSWRPNAVLTRIATKQIPNLPITQINTKPNYYFGQNIPAVPGQHLETLHLSHDFTLGSIREGFGGQMTRWQLVGGHPSAGAVAITGGHPRKSDHTGKKLDELTFRDGGGRYDQSLQFGPVLAVFSRIPAEESAAFVFATVPSEAEPSLVEGLWVWKTGQAWTVVLPLGENAEVVEALGKTPRHLKISGRPAGFVLRAADAADFPDATAAARDFRQRIARKVSRKKGAGEITLRIPGSDDEVFLSWDAQRGLQTSSPEPSREAIFGGPLVELKNSRLRIHDGQDGYEVDFSGTLPIYRPLPAQPPQNPKTTAQNTRP